jgi:hypothetical protein
VAVDAGGSQVESSEPGWGFWFCVTLMGLLALLWALGTALFECGRIYWAVFVHRGGGSAEVWGAMWRLAVFELEGWAIGEWWVAPVSRALARATWG